jgi:hypothetical protein
MHSRDALKRIACIGERPRQDAEGRVAWLELDARAWQQLQQTKRKLIFLWKKRIRS